MFDAPLDEEFEPELMIGFDAPCDRYAVIRFGEEWRLMHGGRSIGEFETQDMAVGVAERLVRARGSCGGEPGLLVQNFAGALLRRSVAV